MPHPIHTLADMFAEMPGIGPRQARRIVQFLLRSDTVYKDRLAEHITQIARKVAQCASCQHFDEIGTNELCAVCANSERDIRLLMVVEKDVDMESIESASVYKGRYFVLGALMPLARQRKGGVSPRIDRLENRLSKDTAIKEVVLAFATTPEGDFTAQELKKILREANPTLTVSMLGRGLSLGAEIEYADQETLRNAFQGRH